MNSDINVSNLEIIAINLFTGVDSGLFLDMGPIFNSKTIEEIRASKLKSYVSLIESFQRNGYISQKVKKQYNSSPCGTVQLYTFYIKNMVEKIVKK